MKNIRRNKVENFEDTTRELNYIRAILEQLPEELLKREDVTTSGVGETYRTGIAARAGGGQSLATVLDKNINEISVCASPGDSVRLPGIFPIGLNVTVINNGVQRADIYPSTGHSIEGMIADTPIQLLPDQRMILKATTIRTWEVA